jgi:DnaJ-domain-containing protein 1
MTDPELVQQSLAVLRAYLAQTGAQAATQIGHTPASPQAGNGAATMPGNGRLRMSTEEALDILGLEPTASAQEIREAYGRLEQKVDPELGGTHYLMAKIIEARDVLLRE